VEKCGIFQINDNGEALKTGDDLIKYIEREYFVIIGLYKYLA